jgi:hypothetical protein
MCLGRISKAVGDQRVERGVCSVAFLLEALLDEVGALTARQCVVSYDHDPVDALAAEDALGAGRGGVPRELS